MLVVGTVGLMTTLGQQPERCVFMHLCLLQPSSEAVIGDMDTSRVSQLSQQHLKPCHPVAVCVLLPHV